MVLPLVFTVADGGSPGTDFLKHFGIKADLQRSRLFDNETGLGSIGRWRQDSSPQLFTISDSNIFDGFRKELVDVTIRSAAAKHDFVHYIIAKGPHVCDRARRLSPKNFRLPRKNFDLCASCYASPLHLVPKQGGLATITVV